MPSLLPRKITFFAAAAAVSVAFILTCVPRIQSFTPIISDGIRHNVIPLNRRASCLFMSSSTLPEVTSMRVGELKKELESYGINTKAFLEKKELVEAVSEARAEGKTPRAPTPNNSSSTYSKAESSSTNSNNIPREELLVKEMENCKAMKASELKAELKSYGVSTTSFFEKSEFVKACAEARVDGAKKTNSENSKDNYAEYSNVEVITDDSAGPRKKSSEQSQSQQSNSPFGGGMPGGGNPFGGGMPGGMGGMGNIADMMKNMGMGGGAPAGGGGNPFGGGMPGGNPFGGGMPGGADSMKKAQEMMSNPKVMEIMMKAQSNPRVMKAVQECMGNPMAFAKYQNDPEIGGLLKDLQKYM